MNDVNPPVTYVRDPALVPPVTPVFIVNGSIALNLAPGEIQIGNVGIEDAVSGLDAQVVKADAAKDTTSNVLLVQSVDTNGDVLTRDDILNLDAGVDVLIAGQAQTQATLTAVLNSQGTQSTAGLATNSTLATSNLYLAGISDLTKAVNDTATAILNGQGTVATAANQTAQNQTIGAGNAILTTILNNEGTLATSAKQDTQIATVGASNALLTSISNHQGTQATEVTQQSVLAAVQAQTPVLVQIASNGTTSPITATLFSGVTSPGASANVDVSNYSFHTVQHVISGSVVVQVRTSLDGVNWNVEDETNQSRMVGLWGKTKFVSANVVYINGSVTTILMSGN